MSENLNYIADLHVHCRRSDGSETAEHILQRAKDLGLTHLVFTDHDTTEGAFDLVMLAKRYGLSSTTGIEISAFDFEKGRRAHILGYGYRETSHIEAVCHETLVNRDQNCVKQIHILQTLGFQIDEESVRQISGQWMYKQHILDVLLRTGQETELFGAVYREIFKNGGPCDFDIVYADVREAVRAVAADGGFAVLAHPGQQDNLDLVEQLVKEGLAGVEYDHPSNDESDKKAVLKSCEKYGLFASGGSDFHGSYERESRPLGHHLAPVASRVIFSA